MIPTKLPPIFMALAEDDDLAGEAVGKFYEALKAAANKREVHIYRAGGHGFGMKLTQPMARLMSDAYNRVPELSSALNNSTPETRSGADTDPTCTALRYSYRGRSSHRRSPSCYTR